MKKKYRVTNWKEYNAALKKRGSLTIWIEEGFENTWYEPTSARGKRGRPFLYSDACINLLATVRHMFKLALRQLEGFMASLFELLKVALMVPEFSRLSRRMYKALSSIKLSSLNENIYLVLDSSELKVYEYCHQKNILPTIPPPKNGKVHSKKEYLAIRNEAVIYIKEKKVEAWENKHKFVRRNRVENIFCRIKTIFGRSYVSRKWENQKEETHLLCHLPNQMTTLGMPKAVKVA